MNDKRTVRVLGKDYQIDTKDFKIKIDGQELTFSSQEEVDSLGLRERPLVNGKALVSFGNYLFNRYGVQVHSNDGMNVPLYERQVTDADLSNWKVGWDIEQKKLPSRFQNGDKVHYLLAGLNVLDVEVIKVHFTESKVLYDLQLQYDLGQIGGSTRIYNVDSSFVMDKNLDN